MLCEVLAANKQEYKVLSPKVVGRSKVAGSARVKFICLHTFVNSKSISKKEREEERERKMQSLLPLSLLTES